MYSALLTVLFMVTVSQGASVPATGRDVTGWATCDNEMRLYADGELKAEDANWPTASYVTFPADTRVVAIECNDTGVVAGIKAAFDNGLKTDKTWKCSTTVTPGWNNAGYDDSAWVSATVAAYSGWGSMPGELDGQAEWIWTEGWNGEDLTVYCRKAFGVDEPDNGGHDCGAKNPCTSLTPDDIKNHRFYYTHISDPARFIQCSQWRQCYDMPCAPNTIWDQDKYTCVRD